MPTENSKRGFILPLAVLLVVTLSISGAAFMHHDYLERRMAMNNVDNHGAFYLANAGMERSREVLNIPNTFTWTPLLIGTGIPANQAQCGSQPLCPDPSRGCMIPAFGPSVSSPAIPFAGSFNAGSYVARAFNNLDDPGGETNDTDQKLTVRSCGTIARAGAVPGEQKLLEAALLAVSNVNLINCKTPPCPSKNNGQPQPCDRTTTPTCSSLEGREPETGSIPTPDFPLANSSNYYRDQTGTKYQTNFPGLLSAYSSQSGNINLTPSNNTYYFVNGNVTLQNVTATNVVIFSTGSLGIKTGVQLTNAILVGVTAVEFKGSATIRAPTTKNYPAVISGGSVTKSSGSASVFGNIYAVGTVDFNPIDVTGATFGDAVKIQGSSTYTDANSASYYAFMPGFNYDNQLKGTDVVSGTWRELQ